MNLQSKVLGHLLDYNTKNALSTNVWGPCGGDAAIQAAGHYGLALQDEYSPEYSLASTRSIPLSTGCSPLLLGLTNHRFLIAESYNESQVLDKVEIRSYTNVVVHNWMDYYVVTSDGMVISDISSRYWPISLTSIVEDRALDPGFAPAESSERAFLWAGDTEFFNFCHFIYDYMPQLGMLRDIYGPLPIIAPSRSASFHNFAAPLMGRHSWSFLDLNHSAAIRVKKLYVLHPHVLHPMYRCSWWAIDFLNSLIDHENQDQYINRVLFVKRSRRTILNEDYMMERLHALGLRVDSVDFDGLTVSQQASLLKSYPYILGIHGAGFTNLVFGIGCKKKVLEVVPIGIGMTSFASLSYRLGFDHAILGVSPVTTSHPNHPDCELCDNDIRTIAEYFSCS
jgi:hypothetical protein